MMATRWIQTRCFILTMLIVGISLSAYAESTTVPQRVITMPGDGYSMVGWVNTASIVEQLQTIRRLSQSASQEAISGLVTALNSPFPLARRKASRCLLEKVRVAQPNEKICLVKELKPALTNSDPVVQRNIVRLMAEANLPESQQSLRQFFQQSDKEAQLSAVHALEQDQQYKALNLARQLSPYGEVRQAAAIRLN